MSFCIAWLKRIIEKGKGNGTEMDWYKVFMWIASICMFTALFFERFLPQIVVVALMLVGSGIMVAIVEYLIDEVAKRK